MLIGTITRRMQDVRSSMFRSLLTRSDFEWKLQELHRADSSARPSVCSQLCSMFRCIGVSCEPGREDAYYDELVAHTRLPDYKSIELKILNAMYRNFGSYPTPAEYMRKIVDHLADPEDGWSGDSLRLRILKQFVKYGSCLSLKRSIVTPDGKKRSETVTIYNGKTYLNSYAHEHGAPKGTLAPEELPKWLDEGVFDALEGATRDQKRPDGRYGLLRLADDLAAGRFKAGSATRRELYLFAIVFEMSYYVGSADPDSQTVTVSDAMLDHDSDIKKNLFEDYYNNNLMRFLTDAYDGNLGTYELDPAGQGINYKNFAEMVYLYYIAHPDYTRPEKLLRSYEMIERLKSRGASADSPELPEEVRSRTGYYASLFTEDCLLLPEDEFEEFILHHYDCRVAFSEEGTAVVRGPLQVENAQVTAFRCYQELLKAIDSMNPGEFSRKNCTYGLWFTDVQYLTKNGGKFQKDFSWGKDADELARFTQLLENIHKFLTRTMDIDKPEDMTRTALVTAYYYYYNLKNEHCPAPKSLEEVYADYTNPKLGLNAMLTSAQYQPVNDKNIFDMAVIFSSYAYMKLG